MSEHKVTLKWARGGAEFSYQKYPRDHTWIFDGGHTMTATAAPAYLGNPANVDPEEAFVASLSSCHMLTFLAIACKPTITPSPVTDLARRGIIVRAAAEGGSAATCSCVHQPASVDEGRERGEGRASR
jgi:organic hydroperoxide reductase OsmC/OhrA